MTERELARNAARRLAIIRHADEVTGNVAQRCRYYGISRQIFYKGAAAMRRRARTACGTGHPARTRVRTPPGLRW